MLYSFYFFCAYLYVDCKVNHVITHYQIIQLSSMDMRVLQYASHNKFHTFISQFCTSLKLIISKWIIIYT